MCGIMLRVVLLGRSYFDKITSINLKQIRMKEMCGIMLELFY